MAPVRSTAGNLAAEKEHKLVDKRLQNDPDLFSHSPGLASQGGGWWGVQPSFSLASPAVEWVRIVAGFGCRWPSCSVMADSILKF